MYDTTITGGVSAVVVNDKSKVVIHNCTLKGNKNDGITLNDDGKSTIYDSKIYGKEFAVICEASNYDAVFHGTNTLTCDNHKPSCKYKC